MTIKDIKETVANIEATKDDDECAHVLEDGLYLEFIMYIASKDNEDGLKARECLKANCIDFSRWYS